MTRLVSLVTAVCLGVVSFLCFQWAAAAFHAKAVQDLVRGWVDATYVIVPNETVIALEQNLRAQKLDPLNPRHRFGAAELYEWRAFLQRKTPGYWESNISLAKEEYEWIIARIPASAYAWISYAESRAELGVFDRQTAAAIDRAIQLGAWDPGVLRRAIHVGMKHWDQWQDDVKRVVQDAVQRVFDMPVHHLDRLDLFVYRNTQVYDWEEMLLPLFRTEAQLEHYRKWKGLN